MKPKGRGTKTSGGVKHGDSYKGTITDIDMIYSNIYIYTCARIIATAFGLHIDLDIDIDIDIDLDIDIDIVIDLDLDIDIDI